MSTETPAVSGSETGNAGNKADPLDTAFNAAFEETGVEDSAFAAEAKPAAKVKTETKQVDTPAPEDAAPAEPGEGGDETETAEEPEAPATPAAPVNDAPAHWDAAKRDAFGKIADAEAKKIVLDLAKGFEADYTRKSTELAEDRKFAHGVRSLITDGHREQLRRSGLDELGGIHRLVQLNDFATRDGHGYVRWVVGSMGVDPRQIFPELAGDGSGQPYEAPQADPQYQQLNGTLQSLQAKLQSFERQQQESQFRTADRAIAQFRDTKDEAGQPRYPHFDRVQASMNWILTSDPGVLAIDDMGQRLQKAYDLAVFADPEIKSQVFESEVARRTAEAAKQADLNKAKRARKPIQSEPVSPSPNAKPKTLEEALKTAEGQLGIS